MERISRSTVCQFDVTPVLKKAREFFQTLYSRYTVYRMRARQRRQLAQMPDYLLKDIGLSRADAEQESDKPFWKE